MDFEIKNGSLVAVKAKSIDPVDQIYECLGKIHTDKLIQTLHVMHKKYDAGSNITNIRKEETTINTNMQLNPSASHLSLMRR